MTPEAYTVELANWLVGGLFVGMLAVFLTLAYGRRS